MRDRLIELCGNVIESCKSSLCADCEHNNIDYPNCMGVHFADYLLANGVIVPPCKVGDKVYEIEKECLGCPHYTDGGYSDWCECTLDDNKLMFEADFDKECIHKIIETKFMYSMIDKIGKTVFLTREEAEAKLKGEQ